MKNIKGYKEFLLEINSDAMNEEILGWLKKKLSPLVSKFSQKIKALKGKALVGLLSAIIPKDIKDLVVDLAAKDAVKEGMLLEEVRKLLGAPEPPEGLSSEEIESLSDEEYKGYLSAISGSLVFDVMHEKDKEGNIVRDKEGNPVFAMVNPSDKDLYDMLIDNGIKVNAEVYTAHKPDIKTISARIDKLKIGDTGKKVLKVACFMLLFFLLASKGYAASTHAHSDLDHSDGVKPPGKLKSLISDVKGDIKGKVSDIKDDIKDKVSDVKDDIKDKVSDIKDDIKDKVSDAKDKVGDAIKNESPKEIKDKMMKAAKENGDGFGVGESSDAEFAKTKAEQNARAEFAKNAGDVKDVKVTKADGKVTTFTTYTKSLQKSVVLKDSKLFKKADGTYVACVVYGTIK